MGSSMLLEVTCHPCCVRNPRKRPGSLSWSSVEMHSCFLSVLYSVREGRCLFISPQGKSSHNRLWECLVPGRRFIVEYWKIIRTADYKEGQLVPSLAHTGNTPAVRLSRSPPMLPSCPSTVTWPLLPLRYLPLWKSNLLACNNNFSDVLYKPANLWKDFQLRLHSPPETTLE